MIGLVIVSILLMVGAPSFSEFTKNRRIRNAADSIYSGLTLAKAEAVRRNTTVQFVMGTGTGWTVGCVNQSGVNDATGADTCPATIQTYSAGSTDSVIGVSATTGTTNALLSPISVVFNGFGQVPASQALGDVHLDLNNSQGTCAAAGGSLRCLRVNVTAGGQVHTCDPAATANTVTLVSNTQAC